MFLSTLSSEVALGLHLCLPTFAEDSNQKFIDMQVFVGPLVHTLGPTTIQYSSLSVVGVSDNGTIDFVVHNIASGDVEQTLQEELSKKANADKGWKAENVKKTVLSHGEFLVPGFVDTHTHGMLYWLSTDHP